MKNKVDLIVLRGQERENKCRKIDDIGGGRERGSVQQGRKVVQRKRCAMGIDIVAANIKMHDFNWL